MSEKYKIATLEEMQILAMPDRPTWSPVRSHLGIEAFGINAWTAEEAGVEVIEEHDELGDSAGKHEEVYVVVKGRATFTVDGNELKAGEGTFVFVEDPAVRRKAVADEAGTVVLAVGAARGEAFTPSNWERSGPAFAFFASHEYDKARDVLVGVHAEFPEDAGVLFNLACAESQLGQADDAIGHLTRSIELQDRFRELARSDTDFDAIRDEPRFKELVGS